MTTRAEMKAIKYHDPDPVVKRRSIGKQLPEPNQHRCFMCKLISVEHRGYVCPACTIAELRRSYTQPGTLNLTRKVVRG